MTTERSPAPRNRHELALDLLQTAYDLFGEEPECADTGTDAWAWHVNAGDLLLGRCPYPIDNDDGTQKQCIANGHCGCLFKESASEKQPTREDVLEEAAKAAGKKSTPPTIRTDDYEYWSGYAKGREDAETEIRALKKVTPIPQGGQHGCPSLHSRTAGGVVHDVDQQGQFLTQPCVVEVPQDWRDAVQNTVNCWDALRPSDQIRYVPLGIRRLRDLLAATPKTGEQRELKSTDWPYKGP